MWCVPLSLVWGQHSWLAPPLTFKKETSRDGQPNPMVLALIGVAVPKWHLAGTAAAVGGPSEDNCPLPLSKGHQWAASSLCWLYCQPKLETLHVGQPSPTWRIRSNGGGLFWSYPCFAPWDAKESRFQISLAFGIIA